MPSPSRHFCIHGHFYQPPREDPWLGRILIEPSAAPMRHWNERIVAESYGPVGWARRLGSDGRITDLVNCYEWMSFNVGPTLLHWMQRHVPAVYARILEADAVSCSRWGHGNAIAQVYHHVIMPLASPSDRELETAWAVADFSARFGRMPEGMWLSECAVDTASLETLAAAGIRFVILAPRQAAAVAGEGGAFRPVTEADLDVSRPYRVDLPSGKTMAVFFYHGALSQAVAFERLLDNGENFWSRINGAAEGGLLTLSTDGETYGHHFRFGEMALAHVLAQGYAGREGLRLTNPAAYLAADPPRLRVRLHEPSSWSCVHGIERWRSNCGCTDGGHLGWNQQWRGPLREALDGARAALDAHFFEAGAACFVDARAALLDYGRVLAASGEAGAFAERHMRGDAAAEGRAWKLLAMQEQALAAFASCAWFFDDISRIEPVNAMTFMWRAMELALGTGLASDPRPAFEAALGAARSNKAEEGSGADVLRRRVLPRRQDAASLCLLALLELEQQERMPAAGASADVVWPAFSVRVTPDAAPPGGPGSAGTLSGKAVIGTRLEQSGLEVAWTWAMPSERSGDCPFTTLDRSAVTVTLPGGETLTRSFADMPRHARTYAALGAAGGEDARARPRLEATARHLLSLMDPWEEAQHGMPCPRDWAALAPYLVLACATDDGLDEARRAQGAEFIRTLALSPAVREKAARLVEEALLAGLAAAAPDWAALARRVERARALLPDMNWWAVQNAFRQSGLPGPERRELALALQFRA